MAGSVTTTGLVAAWNLTGQSAGTQLFSGAHGTSHVLQSGGTAGVDGDDIASFFTYGALMNASGADDSCIASTVPEASLLTDLTVIFVGQIYQSITSAFVSKSAFLADTVNVPLMFRASGVNGNLNFRRAHATNYRQWEGPTPDHKLFQLYAVSAASDMNVAPTFWINKAPYTGVSPSGSGSGSATGNAAPLRVGQVDGITAANAVFSYILVYSRILAADEIGAIWDYTETLLASLGRSTKGFVSHAMSSNTVPSPQVASASSEAVAVSEVFDDSDDAWFSVTNGTEWVQIDLGAAKLPKILGSYQIYQRAGNVSQAGRNWTVSGSNDAVAWTVLDTVTNEPAWGVNETRSYALDTIAGPFRYFRYTVTLNQGHVTNHTLTEWWLYENILATVTFVPGGLPILGIGS